MVKKLIKGTFLSVLIFLSISFLTVLFQINSPLNRIDGYYELRIGFPFEYYYEYMVDCPIPNSGWNLKNLILNCGLTWGIMILLMMVIRKKNKNETQQSIVANCP